MNKNEIKDLLMSMQTSSNENEISKLIGKIDLLTDDKIEAMVSQIGNSEDSIKNYLQRKLNERQGDEHNSEKHIPINEMFSYGVGRKSIHLHMPVDLHGMMKERGVSKTFDTVNLYLLDAIEKIRRLKNEGNPKFAGKDNIYMISPVLVKSEMKFLNDLDFKTQIYSKKDLQDSKFVSEHEETKLAIKIFGKDNNVGTAVIGLNVVNSKEWQEKRKAKVKEFEGKGLTINEESKER